MVNIIFEKGDCSACAKTGTCSAAQCVLSRNPSNNAGSMTVDPKVATWEGCQSACQADGACEFFSWETEVWPSGDPSLFLPLVDGVHRAARCYLKAGFTSASNNGTCVCEGSGDRECKSYAHGEAHKPPTARGTHYGGITTAAACSAIAGAQWNAVDLDCAIGAGADLACVAAGGKPTSTDWDNGVPRYAYGYAPGEHFKHVFDRDWYGGYGPKFCGKFKAQSVRSVAVTTVPGYPNPVVVAAAPHAKPFADGMLAFYDAQTLQYLGCAPAGNKPDGIAASTGGTGKVACVNEGSADSAAVDNPGSMTMCNASSSDGKALTVACSTYLLERKNFKAGEWLHSPAFRAQGVRLYGPNGNNVTYDLVGLGCCQHTQLEHPRPAAV